MAMSVVYSNFGGMVVSETRGGVESDYLHDPLGSTVGLMNSAGTMTDRWEYWPQGEVVSRTGTNATPLTFLGVLGYFKDVLDKLFYVRARYLRVDLACWMTLDPSWPSVQAYEYGNSDPILNDDPSGLRPDGCGGGVDDKLHPMGCQLVAAYFGSKCLGFPMCRLVADIRATGTLSFVFESSCYIGRNNPCTETIKLNCDKHIDQSPIPCPSPRRCRSFNPCRYDSTTPYKDRGPLTGTYPNPKIMGGGTCAYTISDIQYVGSVHVSVTPYFCAMPTTVTGGTG